MGHVCPPAVREGAGSAGGWSRRSIEHARRHVEILQLTVVAGNEPARRLIPTSALSNTAIEKNALKQGGRYWDEVLMAKPLCCCRRARAGSMIPRYSRPQMAPIWEPENRFRIWLEIEAHACEAQAALGVIPESAARAVRERGAFEVERIDEIERETHHDVIAFLTNLAEHVGPEARFVHQGMTSSDVLDTCLAVQLKQAADILLADLDALLAALKRRAFEHKYTPTIGAQPRHPCRADDLRPQARRALCRVRPGPRAARGRARKEIATCAISGAVGTFANIDPRGRGICRARSSASSPSRSRPRSSRATATPQFFMTLALIAAGIERLATEIRHLQRTELREAEEYFAPGQKGSSAMPHKRNPVLPKT